MMKVKIPILGVTKEVEKYERSVIKYLKDALLQIDSNIELSDISFYDSMQDNTINTMPASDKVILLTDACIGNSPEYQKAVEKLYDRRIKPLLLVTHVELSTADLDDVSLIPTNIVGYYDKKAEWYHHVYKSLFFDLTSKKFYAEGEYSHGYDIHLFVKTVNEYINR